MHSIWRPRTLRVQAWLAAQWPGQVLESSDGSSWTNVGTGFPNARVGRIEVAAQPRNPDVLYAFVADTSGLVLGVYRLDSGGGQWSLVANPPDVLPKDEN